MDKDLYVLFNKNNIDKIIFIEKYTKDAFDLNAKTYFKWIEYGDSIEYDVVDISLWQYKNYEEKCLQVQNYAMDSYRIL